MRRLCLAAGVSQQHGEQRTRGFSASARKTDPTAATGGLRSGKRRR